VPAIFVLTILSGGAAVLLGGINLAFGLRCAGLFSLLTFILITLFGTVPINQAVLRWKPSEPPDDWRAMIRTWERLDSLRTVAAVVAFGFFLAATSLR
jgi:uncharacterized membrane protein